jgi:hypothetical protein
MSALRTTKLAWLSLALAGLCVCALLFYCDPAQYRFYPVCTFHLTTGLLCPGCGGLRAMHQLLHGHLGAAFRLNAMLVVTAPLLCGGALSVLLRRLRRQPAGLEIRPLWIWLGVGLVFAYGIGRNLV